MPRTYRNLYPQIYDFDNLYLAWRRARRGGKRKWPAVAAFEFDLERNLWELHDALAAQTYRPGHYRHFTIYEPKVRRISAAPFGDRVVHHALMQIIWPIFEARMIHDSYACRVGKGTHRAIDRCQHFTRGYPYVLQCDVVEFFPSVDHQILREQLFHYITCPPTQGLIDQILNSGVGVLDAHYTPVYFPGDDLFAVNRDRGLPIGNLTSQNWGNWYLNALDQFVKHDLKCPAYLRYCDDFLLFAADKATLWEWRAAIVDFLAMLRLTLHAERAQVYPVKNGIPWLGFRVYPTHRRLLRRNIKAFLRRFRAQREAFQRRAVEPEKIQQSLRAWIAHAAHANTYRLRSRLFREVVF